MTHSFVLKTIGKFAKKKHIKVYFDCANRKPNIGETDGSRIFFGPFSNNEHLLIAFFHAYAHCVLGNKIPGHVEGFHWNNTSTMQYEIQITMAGLEFARKHNILFSDKAVRWLLKENFKYEESTATSRSITNAIKEHKT